MQVLILLQTSDANRAAAFEGIREMNNALPQYIIGHAIATAIFDCALLAVFLSIISIIRALVRRRRVAAH